ncbi:hypothetical protein D9611_006623 [Ephemerocybe angulata]|uniref:Uncharacterized protein n=1 Tax=Ephemerocybe angulata TaxID=980116 RepID=A0A8H5C8C6_9AGAR|nr:hypothetical protein D9611_006623 [Tulosesus angulatus]
MGAQTLLHQVDAAMVKPNIPKQGLGHSGAVHVVFDYNAPNTCSYPRDSYCYKSPAKAATSRGAPAETSPAVVVDKDTPTKPVPPAQTKAAFTLDPPSMLRNGFSKLSLNGPEDHGQPQPPSTSPPAEPLVWDWDIEHEDRRRERAYDAALRDTMPFEVDRRLLKDVVREKMGAEVGRIKFLSAGTFHKAAAMNVPPTNVLGLVRDLVTDGQNANAYPALLNRASNSPAYLVTLVNREDLVARVARRFMPRLKTESEVATVSYLREKTTVPVPRIYHYDSNPYNRLGGEFILMSKVSF